MNSFQLKAPLPGKILSESVIPGNSSFDSYLRSLNCTNHINSLISFSLLILALVFISENVSITYPRFSLDSRGSYTSLASLSVAIEQLLEGEYSNPIFTSLFCALLDRSSSRFIVLFIILH